MSKFWQITADRAKEIADKKSKAKLSKAETEVFDVIKKAAAEGRYAINFELDLHQKDVFFIQENLEKLGFRAVISPATGHLMVSWSKDLGIENTGDE